MEKEPLITQGQLDQIDQMLRDESEDYSEKPLPKVTLLLPLPTGKYSPKTTDNWSKRVK